MADVSAMLDCTETCEARISSGPHACDVLDLDWPCMSRQSFWFTSVVVAA